MSDQDKLEILIDVRSRLEELVKSQEEFRKLREEAGGFGNMLKTGLGIDVARRGLDLLTESIKESAFEAFRLADSIKDSAANLGISTTAYQVLGNVLKDAGGDASLLTMAISQNNRSLVEARTAGSAAAGAYRQLGLDIATLDAMPVEQRFELIGRAVANARDKTAAFAAASQILGSRNLPTLLGGLKDLAGDGYGTLERSMESAGRVMQEQTIARLDAAGKSIERFKQAATIFAGENIGGAMGAWDAAVAGWATDKAGLFAAAGSTLADSFWRPWRLFGFEGGTGIVNWLVKNVPAAPTASGTPAPDGSAAKQIELTNALTKAEFELAAAGLKRQTIENDPNFTGLSVEARHLDQMQIELKLREKLISATKAMPIEGTNTAEAQALKIKKLEEQNQQLRDQIKFVQSSNQFNEAGQTSRDKFGKFQLDKVGDQGGISSGFASGAMDWVTNLGSQGQQVAGALQNTLGSTVQGISSGIMGWVDHTQSFGAAMLQLGGTVFKTFLDTIIQMGVQWLVTQTLVKTGMISTHAVGETLRASRMTGAAAEGATTTAALAPAAATASISSFGAAAILGIIALVAAMAIFGGFSGGGYTGDMPTDAVAGVVHGQEHVMTAATTRRLGPAFFDHLNAGGSPATASAASASKAFGGTGVAASGGRDSIRANHFYFDPALFAAAIQEHTEDQFHRLMAKELRS